MNPSSSGSFDEAWPQSVENSQRMWSFDRTVQMEKPLATFPWRSIGFYALTGQSAITFKERLVKETVVESLEEIRKQNLVGGFCSWTTTTIPSRETHPETGRRTPHRVRLHSLVFTHAQRDRTALEEY